MVGTNYQYFLSTKETLILSRAHFLAFWGDRKAFSCAIFIKDSGRVDLLPFEVTWHLKVKKGGSLNIVIETMLLDFNL
jgi:hypothetical protein